MFSRSCYNKIAVVILGLAATGNAHTWIEQMMVVAPNGTMVGSPGYARGNVMRSDPGFSDPTMVNLIPPNGGPINIISNTTLMCKSTQTDQIQSADSPRLQAAPGSSIALRYQENGHVTLPQNQPGKPPNRGTVYVYGTTQSTPDDLFLYIHRNWTADGTGGNGKGVLLSTQNFDDGQCYQVNSGSISTQRQQEFPHTANTLMGADMWCQQDIAIPANAPTGQPYTLYWVWDWPTLPGTPDFQYGKQEIYTTCMDVDIVDSTGSQSEISGNSFIQGQALDSAAISSEMADITNPTAVVGSTIPFETTSGAEPTAAATGSALSDTATEFSITTGAGGVHSIISASVAASIPTGAAPSVSVDITTPGPAITPSATAAQSSRPGFGGHGHGGQSQSTESALTAVSYVSAAPSAASFVPGQEGLAGATVTDWASVTMTVFQTVFNEKRNVPQTLVASESSVQSSACTATLAPLTYSLRGRLYVVPRSDGPTPTTC